jgi:hypothetical protein
MYGFGDDSNNAALVRALHDTAVKLYAAKQAGDKAEVARLLGIFEQQADAIRAQGDTDMTAIDRFILAVGNYLEGVVDALPSALAALPTAAGKALGMSLSAWIVPLALIGGGLYFASKTPGVRRLL